MSTQTIHINNQKFILHPSGSIFWVDKKVLLIADVHLGKISHFRKFGFAVPPDSISKNFLRLAEIMDEFNPQSVCFLGDLFHSSMNNEWDLFAAWVSDIEAQIILIAGNHDIISPQRYQELGIDVFKELTVDDFLLTHHPTERSGFFNFSGHIHPCVLLQGKGRQFLKLPCFFHKPNQMILPAFGEFTGTYELVPSEDDKVYAVTKEEVIFIPKRDI